MAVTPVSSTDYTPDELRTYVLEVCGALGSEPTEASLVADQLVTANLSGHDSHGVGMMPAYVDSVRGGRLFVNRHPSVARDDGAVLLFDGNRAFGQVAGYEAINAAIERAGRLGVAIMGLRDSFHIGRIGHWGEQCARAGMVSIHFVNVAGHAPSVAPWGGYEARFVTNPVCIAIPGSVEADGTRPVALLDMATSVIAQGKARVAMLSQVPVPEGSVVDGEGRPTTDPAGLFARPREGALLAFGRHKGSGLAIMAELLGAALLGGTTISPHHERDGSALNSMLTIVIDPDALGGRGNLVEEALAFTDYVRSSAVRDGFDEVLIPGEPEYRARRQRADAVPVDAGTVDDLRRAAGRAGLDDDAVTRLLG
ncbi:MAG: malate/lactate/ureidoglycolate dehydrogenase [Acidimicrobiales bacterium]